MRQQRIHKLMFRKQSAHGSANTSAMQAVSQGRWVVIEDVNLAPPDVLAALIPLLDSRELHLSQRGQTIRAAPTFQLLATVTCSPGTLSSFLS